MFEARGEILTVPAEKGDARNLTNAPGSAERDPAWRSALVHSLVNERRSPRDVIGLDVAVESLEENRLRSRGRELLAVPEPDRCISGEAQVGGPILANDRIRADLDVRDRRFARAYGFTTGTRAALLVLETSAARDE